MNDTLKQFVDNLFAINPPMISILGGGVPGMSGSAASTQGATTSGGDVTQQLRAQTITFAQAYNNSKQPTNEIQKLAEQIEGSLLVEQTLSVLNAKQVDSLINQLHDLVDNR